MATIDDFGGTADPLASPPLGGPTGWAAAVRDAIVALPDKAYVDTLRAYGGVATLSGTVPANGALDSVRVDFGMTFASRPLAVMAFATTNGYVAATRTAPADVTGFSVNLYNLTSNPATLFSVEWVAIGTLA